MTEQNKNYFQELAAINVSKQTEVKEGFTYLSWAFAQEILGQHHPKAIIEVKEYGDNCLPYLQTPLGYFVQVTVEIEGVKRGRPFPVTDGANRPLGAEYWVKKDQKYVMNRQPTSFDINTSIQRAFVKAVAEHGLGLYVYRGEDLPTAVVEDRRDTIMKDFKAWRENPKTDKYFLTKEALLGPMAEWDMGAMEGIHKELKMFEAKAAEKKAAEELARREKPAETEEEKSLKDKGMDLSKQNYILNSCKAYPLVDEAVGEYMTKHKKETLTSLTGKQFETLYSIVERKVKTAEKELAENASS